MMGLLTPIIGLGGASAVPAEVTFRAAFSTSSSSRTFSGQALGTEAADRVIIVASMVIGTISSITVDGTSLTQIATAVGNNSTQFFIHAGLVPTGTTGDVVVSGTFSFNRDAYALWSATGLQDESTATDTLSSTASPATGDLDVNEGGIAVGIAYGGDTDNTATWSGLDEDHDGPISGQASRYYSAGSASLEAAQTVAVSVTYSSTVANNRGALFASLR